MPNCNENNHEDKVSPKISIVMATFNERIDYLEASIGSILAQSYQDFELIVVDDGSSFDAKKDIERLVKRKSRIKLVSRTENRGLAYSLNEGVSLAQGAYIARMDSDDISHPLRLEKQLAALESRPDIAVIGSQAIAFGAQRRLIKVPINDCCIEARLFFNSCFVHPSTMMRKTFITSMSGYNCSVLKGQDYDLWARGKSRGYQYANLKDVLLKYRTYTSAISADKVRQQLLYSQAVRHQYLAHAFPQLGEGSVNAFLYLASPVQCLSFTQRDVKDLFDCLFSKDSITAAMRVEVLKRLGVLAIKYRDFRSLLKYLRNFTGLV